MSATDVLRICDEIEARDNGYVSQPIPREYWQALIAAARREAKLRAVTQHFLVVLDELNNGVLSGFSARYDTAETALREALKED